MSGFFHSEGKAIRLFCALSFSFQLVKDSSFFSEENKPFSSFSQCCLVVLFSICIKREEERIPEQVRQSVRDPNTHEKKKILSSGSTGKRRSCCQSTQAPLLLLFLLIRVHTSVCSRRVKWGGPTKDTMRQFVIQAHARTHLGSREREKRP